MRHRPQTRGSILLLTLIVSAIITAVVTAFFNYLGSAVVAERVAYASAQAQALAQAGVDEAVYQLNTNGTYTGETNTPLGSGVFTVSVTGNGSTEHITATGAVPNSTNPTAEKTIQVDVSINTSVVAFHYGAQVGAGGVEMNNGSIVQGNIYADGPISGSGTITGDATAASTSAISGVTVQGNAWAYSLSSCTIGGNATYQTTNTCSVTGTTYPNSTPASTAPLPISDAQIASWESTAASGGVISGNYSVSGTQVLGPKEIDGDLTIGIGATLVLSGPVWVNGNITMSNNGALTVSSGTGNSGAIIIADATGNTSTNGWISISNNATLAGNGSTGSYPMLISTCQSSQAINLSNNANSAIIYAPHGTVEINNNANLNEVTAYKLMLDNNATVTYVSGLESSSFSNGPGGSWAVVPGTYAIQ